MNAPTATSQGNDASLLVRLPRALRDSVNVCAGAEGKSQNQFVIEALQVWCDSSEDMRKAQEQQP